MSATATAPLTAPAPTAALVGDTEVRNFVDDGFLIRPGLVGQDELAELKQDLVSLARGHYPCEQIRPAPAEASDEAVLRDILCIHQPHFISPVMRRFVAHPGIAAVLGRVCGAHLAHWDGSVKCMQSMVFAKPPGKPGQAWHQDERYIPTRDRSLIGAWIAIDDATVENGCLWVVPGSHRDGYMYPTRACDSLDEYDGSDQAHGFDEAAAIPVEVKAGSVVFFNGYLLHKSLKNRSRDSYRRVLVNHYMNAWSLLPWQLEPAMATGEAYVGTGDNRTVMLVAGSDPYAWKGTQAPPQAVYLRSYGQNKGAAGTTKRG